MGAAIVKKKRYFFLNLTLSITEPGITGSNGRYQAPNHFFQITQFVLINIIIVIITITLNDKINKVSLLKLLEMLPHVSHFNDLFSALACLL